MKTQKKVLLGFLIDDQIHNTGDYKNDYND